MTRVPGPAAAEPRALLNLVLGELYTDRIYPSPFTLAARLQVQGGWALEKFIEVARMHPEEYELCMDGGGALTGLVFRKAPAGFEGWVDPKSDQDPYPSSLWMAFEMYSESLARDKNKDGEPAQYAFHGGRFGMAVELRRRDLPFLRGRCLGELCHLVQLAVSRGLFAYESSASGCSIVPVDVLASRPSPEVQNEMPCVRSKKELCDIVRHLLRLREDGVNLSDLKQKIRCVCRLRLSETTFGCTKLIEVANLLVEEKVCLLDLDTEKNCHKLLPRPSWARGRAAFAAGTFLRAAGSGTPASAPCGQTGSVTWAGTVRPSNDCGELRGSSARERAASGADGRAAGAPPPPPPSNAARDYALWGCVVKNTFLEAIPPRSGSPPSQRKVRSWPSSPDEFARAPAAPMNSLVPDEARGT